MAERKASGERTADNDESSREGKDSKTDIEKNTTPVTSKKPELKRKSDDGTSVSLKIPGKVNIGKSPVSKFSGGGIAIKLDSKSKSSKDVDVQQHKKAKLASVFNNDSDSEEEEMPLECRMKMRNIGRDTITSSGPKSFAKGSKGFSHNNFKAFELSLKPRNSLEKQNKFADNL